MFVSVLNIVTAVLFFALPVCFSSVCPFFKTMTVILIYDQTYNFRLELCSILNKVCLIYGFIMHLLYLCSLVFELPRSLVFHGVWYYYKRGNNIKHFSTGLIRHK